MTSFVFYLVLIYSLRYLSAKASAAFTKASIGMRTMPAPTWPLPGSLCAAPCEHRVDSLFHHLEEVDPVGAAEVRPGMENMLFSPAVISYISSV